MLSSQLIGNKFLEISDNIHSNKIVKVNIILDVFSGKKVIFGRSVKMEVLGLEFAPLNIPFKRRLQTLAAACWFVVFAFGGFMGLLLAFYLILFSSVWSAVLLYVIWAWTVDKDSCNRGTTPFIISNFFLNQ